MKTSSRLKPFVRGLGFNRGKVEGQRMKTTRIQWMAAGLAAVLPMAALAATNYVAPAPAGNDTHGGTGWGDA